jgi:NTE family protein
MSAVGGLVSPGQQLGLLSGLAPESLQAIERAVREVRLPAGATLFEAGDVGDALFVVRSGLVDVVGTGPSRSTRLTTIGPGETVGEQSLLSGRPRSATAVAQTGVTLWRLDHIDFLELLATTPQLGANVARILSERLTAASRTRLGLPRGQTVVVCSRTPQAVVRVARMLKAFCARLLGEDALLVATGPEEAWGTEPLPAGTSVHDTDDLTGIAVRAVREHALVLILCQEGGPAALLDGADRLVVIGDMPATTRRDNEVRKVHVLPETPDDTRLRALSRQVCGRRIGLALGSGGIRGFAHAGVFGVLADQDIPIDFVSGASAGAVAGALLLSGMAPGDVADLAVALRETLKTGRPSLTLSPQSLLSGRRLLAFLRNRLGRDTTFADLPTPFVVAATDLDSRQAVHLDSGPLPEAVVASTAVNGIFPPVSINRRRLVDGGASDPVPVTALRDRGADIVIAVNTMTIGHGPLGAFVQLPRIRIPMPGLLENLFIGLDTVTSQIAAHACRQADVVVEPTSANLRWYDVMPAQAYMHAGEQAMQGALPQVRALVGS